MLSFNQAIDSVEVWIEEDDPVTLNDDDKVLLGRIQRDWEGYFRFYPTGYHSMTCGSFKRLLPMIAEMNNKGPVNSDG